MREWSLAKRLTVQVLVSLAIGVVVATIGPFGTYTEFATQDRYLYWIIIIPVNWLQIAIAITLIGQLKIAERMPQFLVVAIGCLIASFPASFEVLWLEGWLRSPYNVEITAWILWPYVLLLSLVIALPLKKYMWYGPSPQEPPDSDQETTAPQATSDSPPFLKRIPGHLGQNLLCVESEDHYLRIHTDAGSDLILYRMSDALSDLEGANGLQVHRSFWVARDAITEVERNGKRVSLKLANGLVVPISRTYLPTVRQAGWLDGAAPRPTAQST